MRRFLGIRKVGLEEKLRRWWCAVVERGEERGKEKGEREKEWKGDRCGEVGGGRDDGDTEREKGETLVSECSNSAGNQRVPTVVGYARVSLGCPLHRLSSSLWVQIGLGSTRTRQPLSSHGMSWIEICTFGFDFS